MRARRCWRRSAANIVNIALATTFVFALGWGVAGVAAGDGLAQSLEAAFLWLLTRRRARLAQRGAARTHFARSSRVGPADGACSSALEVGAFAILTAFISSLSETQMAAHQIALQACQFSFLPAFAIAEGAQVLAGQAVGARREELVWRVAWLALVTAGVYTARVLARLRRRCAAARRRLHVVGGAVAVTVRLLRVAALFQVSDGANIVARAVLRGVGDMRFAAIIGVATAWMMTPPLTWLLGCARASRRRRRLARAVRRERARRGILLWRRVALGRGGAARRSVVDAVDGAHAQAA